MKDDLPLDLIINQLKTYDEVEICDMLRISSEDLIRRFSDRITVRRKFLEQELEIYSTGDLPDEKEHNQDYKELNFNED